jgi:hypothetical protein
MPVTLLIALAVISIVLVALGIAGHRYLRPRMLHWGAAPDEIGSILEEDELIPDPILDTTRAVHIHAGRGKVWPWLVQIGQGRGGFYSYDWLENLAGMDIHNTYRIIPELQSLKPGDLIPFWRGGGVNVVMVEPPGLLVLAGTFTRPAGETGVPAAVGGTWVFDLKGQEPNGTRLLVRARVARFQPGWLCWVMMRALEPMHFVMERKMMLRIKELAESAHST